jgi:glycosyltransferase involved in cell wall biosynthesis
MRIAWFSPLPPNRSGIAAYSTELLPLLASHDIEAFVDDTAGREAVDLTEAVPGAIVRGAYEFSWRQAVRPFDLVVYHVGNESCHDYMWPYMVRHPGLVVLHDAQLHQSRAQALIRQGRPDDFRAEFAYCHPGVPSLMADFLLAGLGAAVCYFWPMTRVPIRAARMVAVHGAWLARDLRDQHPGADIRQIRMGVPDPLAAGGAAARDVRRRHGIPDDAIVFGSFGRVTPEKGLGAVVKALSQVASSSPAARLLVVGEGSGHFDLMAQAQDLGVADRVTATGYVTTEALPEYLAAVDVCLNLRWPTGRETSAAWLRCLAAGKPTVVTDLVHTTDVPSLDLRATSVPCTPAGAQEPVCVRIELIDEVNMLRLALRRLAEDADLRARLGSAARRYWETRGTPELMAADYEGILAAAMRAADPVLPAGWPAHLRADGSSRARALASEVGVPYPLERARTGVAKA